MTAFYLTTLFLAALSVVSGQTDMPKIHMEASEPVVYPGAVVQFTCRLTGFTERSVIVMIEKEAPVGTPVRTVKEFLSQSTRLLTMYRDMPRFSIERNIVDYELTYTLTINGVKLEDSGWYTCSAIHYAYGEMFGTAVFQVYRPPTVGINLNDTYTIMEGEVLPLECISKAVLPIPQMELWITDSIRPYIDPHLGGELLPAEPEKSRYNHFGAFIDKLSNVTEEKWRDVTNDFLTSTLLNTRCYKGSGSTPHCPLHYDYDLSATRSEFKPDFRHDERQITCISTMRHMARDSANASVLLDVRYSPKIFCEGVVRGKSLVARNSSTHKITCRVISNPPVEAAGDRFWSAASCAKPASPIPSSSAEFGTSEMLVSDNKKNRILVLEWKKPVTVEYFQKSYCLRVKNEVGATNQEFQLVENLEDSTQSASRQTSSWVVCLTTALLPAVTFMLSSFN